MHGEVCQPARLLWLDVCLPGKNCCLWATNLPRAGSGTAMAAWTGVWEGGDNWHHGVQRLVRDLNHAYRHHKALQAGF